MIIRKIKNSTLWHNPKEKVPEFTQHRITFLIYIFFAVYGLITARLCQFIVTKDPVKLMMMEHKSHPRFDVFDRNGELLATDIITHSVFIDPWAILDPQETATALAKVLPGFTKKQILEKFEKKGRFVWIARHIDPALKEKIFNLGLSGVFFKEEYKRMYLHGSLVSHIVGHCDPDNTGIYGIERSFDQQLKTKGSVQLALDLRVQHIVRSELKEGIKKYQARAGNALIMDDQGQILSAVSLPDFDPFDVQNIKNTFNRNFQGCYEPGSVLKILNVAISLQMNVINRNSTFDATKPVKIGRFTVCDFRAKNRVLTLKEAFVHSSNIAMIEMANHYGERYGIGVQKQYFKKLGLLEKTQLEVKELGFPIIPQQWTKATFQTLAYGYGLAMPPVAFLKAVANILTNSSVKPTLIKNTALATQKSNIFRAEVSTVLEELMRATVLNCANKKAQVLDYHLIGKSGTALQCVNGHYDQNTSNTTYISCLIDKTTGKKFFILVMLEAPQPVEGTYGFKTGIWNCAPITKEIVMKAAPLLGVRPISKDHQKEESDAFHM